MAMTELTPEELEEQGYAYKDWAEDEENPKGDFSVTGFIEWIICPECSMNQEAWVRYSDPNDVREHECEQCNYLITADEWLIDSDE